MRIRSIKPEFWRSEDISQLDWDTRLIFIGLWSYVDDNGVGRDQLASIAADLFANDIELDSSETFARVSRGLQKLSEVGLIHRYKVDNKAFLEIDTWSKHQRIDKPNKARYPHNDAEFAEIRESVASVSRESSDWNRGTGEQRNRGTEEQGNSKTIVQVDLTFDEFWSVWPKRRGVGEARKAWAKAIRKEDKHVILDAARQYAQSPFLPEMQFIPLASTWLNQERWGDDLPQPTMASSKPTAAQRNLSTVEYFRNQEALAVEA